MEKCWRCKKVQKMGKAIVAFICSMTIGIWLSFFNLGMGAVASISVIGAVLIYQNDKK